VTLAPRIRLAAFQWIDCKAGWEAASDRAITSQPADVRGARVTFEPGARTAWHTHPLGQTLIVTSGLGWAQCEGEAVAEIRPDDVVWFPPGQKHWHGASPTTAMTHIAIQEAADGKVVEWMEHVTDEQYRKS
jgi:quercetin dioxygenase-like cupin family protein